MRKTMRTPLSTLTLVSMGMVVGCTGDTRQPDENGTTLSYEDADYADERGQTRALEHDLGPGAAAIARERTAIDAARMEPANVLIWYSHDYGQLRATLQDLGHQVTTSTTLPDDLSTYDVIWHVGAFRSVSTNEHQRLLAFLAADGGLHMTGERPCCESLNQSWTQLVNAAVRGGGITIGRQGDIFAITGSYAYPYPVSPDAKESIATMPKQVENLRLIAAGGIVGLAGAANVLAYGRATDGKEMPVGALWSSDDLVGGSGRLSILMDANWFSLMDSADNAAMVANLQIFLQGSATNQCPVAQAGADRSLACLAPGERAAITLNGTEASDGDGDGLTYEWHDAGGRVIASGPMPTVELPAGEHDIALVVDDGICTSAPDTVHVSLHADEEPPRLQLRGESPTAVECGQAYVDPGAMAEDACSGDLTARIVTTGMVDTSTAGIYAVVYEVTDDIGLSARDSRTVVVEDRAPPVIEVVPMIDLWAPDHAYHTFTLADCVAAIHDTCDAALDVNRAGRILWVASNEPDNVRGDGHTSGDIVVVDDATFQVRAERMGKGSGRVYEVGFAVTDASGNTARAVCRLGVPHTGS